MTRAHPATSARDKAKGPKRYIAQVTVGDATYMERGETPAQAEAALTASLQRRGVAIDTAYTTTLVGGKMDASVKAEHKADHHFQIRAKPERGAPETPPATTHYRKPHQ